MMENNTGQMAARLSFRLPMTYSLAQLHVFVDNILLELFCLFVLCRFHCHPKAVLPYE